MTDTPLPIYVTALQNSEPFNDYYQGVVRVHGRGERRMFSSWPLLANERYWVSEWPVLRGLIVERSAAISEADVEAAARHVWADDGGIWNDHADAEFIEAAKKLAAVKLVGIE